MTLLRLGSITQICYPMRNRRLTKTSPAVQDATATFYWYLHEKVTRYEMGVIECKLLAVPPVGVTLTIEKNFSTLSFFRRRGGVLLERFHAPVTACVV